jgi:hypothetical protein
VSEKLDLLRFRRAALLERSELQRLDWQDHLQRIEGALDGVDRGLGLWRRVAKPGALLAGGVLATLLLGRRRTKRLLAGGLLLVGQLALRRLNRGQRVRRSR